MKKPTKKKTRAGVVDKKNVHSILKQMHKFAPTKRKPTKRVVKGKEIYCPACGFPVSETAMDKLFKREGLVGFIRALRHIRKQK